MTTILWIIVMLLIISLPFSYRLPAFFRIVKFHTWFFFADEEKRNKYKEWRKLEDEADRLNMILHDDIRDVDYDMDSSEDIHRLNIEITSLCIKANALKKQCLTNGVPKGILNPT